jgi:hypothetical protein
MKSCTFLKKLYQTLQIDMTVVEHGDTIVVPVYDNILEQSFSSVLR